MKQTIEIEVPQGYEAKYDSATNKVEMVKKDSKPKSWEEFCHSYPVKNDEWFIDNYSHIISCSNVFHRNVEVDKNICTSKKETEAFLALIQLRQLRKAWVGDWEPDWCQVHAKYNIECYNNDLDVTNPCHTSRPLSFPTEEMAYEFISCFKDLLETAKPLL